MPEPAPTPTPTPADPPAPPTPAAADNNTPLGVANAHGWATVGDVIAAFNKASGQLGNPQAPEKYSLDAIGKFWSDKTTDPENPITFDGSDPEFQALSTALREGGASQKQFDKITTAFTEAINRIDTEGTTVRINDAVAKVGGAEAFQNAIALADKAGVGEAARAASGDELVALNRMINAANRAGGLGAPGGNPADPNAPPASGDYHPECQATINGQVVGIDPKDFNSFAAFKQLVIGADEKGNGGRPFYKTPQGQQIYAKAQQIRAALMRDPSSGVVVGGAAKPPPAA